MCTTRRGWVQLAERGRQLLGEPGPVTVARLQEFPGWHEAWGTAALDQATTTGSSEPVQESGTTPEEQIANGIEQLEANVRGGQLVVASTAESMRTAWDWSASTSRPSGIRSRAWGAPRCRPSAVRPPIAPRRSRTKDRAHRRQPSHPPDDRRRCRGLRAGDQPGASAG